MNKAIDLTNKMENDKTITPAAALMFRSSTAIKPLVFERTHNNPQLLTETIIQDIIRTYVIDQPSADKQSAVDSAVIETTKDLHNQFSDAIIERETKLAQASEEIRNNMNRMRINAENKAQKIAMISKSIVKFILQLACFFVLSYLYTAGQRRGLLLVTGAYLF